MSDFLQLLSHEEMNKIALKRAKKEFKKQPLSKSQCDYLKRSFVIINEILANPHDRRIIVKDFFSNGAEHMARIVELYRDRLDESIDNTVAVLIYVQWHHLTHCDILEEMIARSDNLLQDGLIHQPMHTLLKALLMAQHEVSYYQPSWLRQFDNQSFWNRLKNNDSSRS